MPDNNDPIGIGDAILHMVIAVVLTYFFFTPGKEAISAAVKSLIQ